jgi:hypothetical protein
MQIFTKQTRALSQTWQIPPRPNWHRLFCMLSSQNKRIKFMAIFKNDNAIIIYGHFDLWTLEFFSMTCSPNVWPFFFTFELQVWPRPWSYQHGLFLPLNSKCDLELGVIDVILSRDTPSNDGEQMCQMILKSHYEWHSYCPDKLIYGHF